MARKTRKLKPRTRESVENRQLDADADSGRSLTPRGDHSINPNVSNVRFDKLRCYKKGKTVLRLWNMLDPETPGEALLNGRLSAIDLAGLGGVSISEPALCAQYAGIHKDSGTFLGNDDAEQVSYIIARSKNSQYEGIQFWDLPYPKLYVMAKKARDSGEFGHGGAWNPKWNALMSGQMPALGSFKQRYFVVCSVLENGSNVDLVRERVEYRKDGKDVAEEYPRNGIALGDAPDDPVMVLQLPVSAGKKLLAMSCVEKADYNGDPDTDPSVMYRYGDPCGKFDAATQTVKGGLFFTIYNPEKVKIEKHTSYKGVINPTIVEYECAVSNKHAGPNGVVSASLDSEQVDNIFNKHLFLWKDSEEDPKDSYFLHEPSIEERCELLARAFKQVPKLLQFCWMSQPQYMQFDSVKAIFANRVSSGGVAKPGMDDDDDEVPFDAEDAEPTAKKKKKSKSAEELVDEFDDDDDDDDDDGDATAEVAEAGEDEFDDDDDGEIEAAGDDDDDDDDDDDEFDDDDDDGAEAATDSDGDEFDDSEVVDKADDEFDDDDDDDDGSSEAGEEAGESDDFDDEAEPDAELSDQLDESLAKAKGLQRSKKRSSKKAAAATSTKKAPAKGKATTKKATKKKKATAK